MSLTTTSTLADTAWWRLVVERLGRQFAQTALPLFAVITAAPGEFEPKAFAVAAVLALALSLGLSILRELVAITPSVDAALPWRLLDRAVPAAAGVLVGLWPVDVAGLLTFDWRNALVAAGFAALSAALAYVWTPPAYAHLSEDGTPAITNLPEVAGDDDVNA